MKKIAVIGVGAIGGLLGAYLTKGGHDVTVISCFRRENADYMAAHGIAVDGAKGSFHVDIKSVFIQDLGHDDVFDIFIVALKGNDTQRVLEQLKDHLRPDGYCLTLQNGLNEDLIAAILGQNRVVYAISRAGGALTAPGHVCDHDGEFVIGEADNARTPRILELKQILSCARPTSIANDIIDAKWEKLCTVALSVPACTVSGIYLSDIFFDSLAHQLYGLLALEIFRVAAASGHPIAAIMDRTPEAWLPIAQGLQDGAWDRSTAEIHFPPKVVDAYTQDIRRGRPLEIDYTNGAVIRLGKKYGVATPVNQRLVDTIYAIEKGAEQPGKALLQRIIDQSLPVQL